MDDYLGIELEDPSDWPAHFPELRQIDELLRCPICKEYFETSLVSSNCGHTFCSLCLRRCLAQQDHHCPSCRVKLTESDLYPNRLVDNLLVVFRKGRGKLLETLTNIENNKEVDSDFEDMVECPGCSQQMDRTQINRHLDRCLTKRTAGGGKLPSRAFGLRQPASGTPTKSTLPRPTKLVYSLLSESKLRRTLKELGIPSKGDKQQMQQRHTEWFNLYMANQDSESPVSDRLLLKRLSGWEDTTMSAVSRPTDMAQHMDKYRDTFDQLKAQATLTKK